MIVVAVLVLLGLAYYSYFRYTRRRIYELASKLPDAFPLPIIGNIHQFVGGPDHILKGLHTVTDEILKKGGIGKVWLGSRLYVVILKPEDAQIVLETCLQKDMVYKFLQAWLGNGLFVAPVDIWKMHRRVMLPVFHNRIIEEYIELFGEQTQILVEKLREKCGNGEFDVFQFITACTLDIVFETAMGEKMEVQKCPETAYLKARHTVMSLINLRLFKPWLQPDFLFNLTPYAKQQEDNISLTHKFTDEVVKKKREAFYDTGKTVKGKRQAILDMLLDKEIRFTDEQLREHIDSITIAGNDTTALVIAYTLVLLGVHHDWQEKVYQEQKKIFGELKRPPSKEDLMKMNCLERVIKESMRLYTVVPIIARSTDRDVQLSTFTVPAGVGCVIGSFAMHRSKEIWGENADDFDPDRFLPEHAIKRHPCSFIPFSFGSRNCIGRYFGMLVMKTMLSDILRNYKVSAEKVCNNLKIEILLLSKDGHMISLEKRTS